MCACTKRISFMSKTLSIFTITLIRKMMGYNYNIFPTKLNHSIIVIINLKVVWHA